MVVCGERLADCNNGTTLQTLRRVVGMIEYFLSWKTIAVNRSLFCCNPLNHNS